MNNIQKTPEGPKVPSRNRNLFWLVLGRCEALLAGTTKKHLLNTGETSLSLCAYTCIRQIWRVAVSLIKLGREQKISIPLLPLFFLL